jgi:hypothetical protein
MDGLLAHEIERKASQSLMDTEGSYVWMKQFLRLSAAEIKFASNSDTTRSTSFGVRLEWRVLHRVACDLLENMPVENDLAALYSCDWAVCIPTSLALRWKILYQSALLAWRGDVMNAWD